MPTTPPGAIDDIALLQEGLNGLSRLHQALATRAIAYIVSGTDADVLPSLTELGKAAGQFLGLPGRARGALDPVCVDAAVTAGLAARHTFYQRASLVPASVGMLVRLGKVLAAADNGERMDRTSYRLPAWLQYLLNDALWAVFPEDQDGAATPAALLAARPAWDVTLIDALLGHADLDRQLLLPALFEQDTNERWYPDQLYIRLGAPGPLDDYLLAHVPEVDAAADAMTDHGRMLLLDRIGEAHALAGAYEQFIARLAVCSSERVRDVAERQARALDKERGMHLLGALMNSGTEDQQAHAIALAASLYGKDAIPLFDAALLRDVAGWTRARLKNAIGRLCAGDAPITSELPAPPPLPPVPAEVLGADVIDLVLDNRRQMLVHLRQEADQEIIDNRTAARPYLHRQHWYARYRTLTETQLRDAIAALNGDTAAHATGILQNRVVTQTLQFQGSLAAHPDFGLLQVLRWRSGAFAAWLNRELASKGKDFLDLRQLVALDEACGGELHAFALTGLRLHWAGDPLLQDRLAPDRIWPLYAARPGLIDEGLGLAQGINDLDAGCTLGVLATFPVIPERWIPRVLELALGDGKTRRTSARQVLARVPGIGERVAAALQSSKQEVRIEAARWLGHMKDPSCVPALNAALAKESRETVSAVMLTALEQLGADMAMHLAPAKLLAQARKGLKGKAPAGMAWLDLETAPACQWIDGSTVDADIVRWWVILACKLKEPGGNALLERYLGLLDAVSRAALGRWVLHQFIGRDTARQPLEAGIAWAHAHAPSRYANYQHFAKQYPREYAEEAAKSLDQIFEEVKLEKMEELLGSAIGEKGLLALVWGTPGAELVGVIASFMVNFHLRRAQIEALIEAASVSDEPAVIQFVLATARRHRTASVQEKARALVQNIADRNGWSTDQLADRTVPAGGLDEDGRLLLQYGDRTFTVTLDAAMKPVLANAEGKTVSALPAPRQDEAPETLKEAKQQLATCKKELKQVIDMQGARLYDAMCAGRAWPLHEWRTYLLAHPIVGRLVQRLVWLTDTGATFRPAEDGSLIDAADDTVTLAAGATIRLAHAALVSKEDAGAWTRHVKDYKVSPLFAQMTRALPGMASGAIIDDRLGWLSDAYKLRAAFTKHGYQRGATGSRGIFEEYKKECAGAGITVAIAFSGSALPEENRPAALKTLSFRTTHGPVAPDQVPPVLLAEAWADYHAVAAASGSYDADWERKIPW